MTRFLLDMSTGLTLVALVVCAAWFGRRQEVSE